MGPLSNCAAPFHPQLNLEPLLRSPVSHFSLGKHRGDDVAGRGSQPPHPKSPSCTFSPKAPPCPGPGESQQLTLRDVGAAQPPSTLRPASVPSQVVPEDSWVQPSTWPSTHCSCGYHDNRALPDWRGLLRGGGWEQTRLLVLEGGAEGILGRVAGRWGPPPVWGLWMWPA